MLGKLQVPVTYRNQQETLPLIVVDSKQNSLPPLLGRNWLEKLHLDWKSLFVVHSDNDGASLLKKYAEVFGPELGLIKGQKAKLVLKEDARPVFCKHRPVPYALRQAVEEELHDLVDRGVLVPESKSDWATPLVVVPKPNNKVRLCGDFKVTINPAVKTDHYPLPLVDDIFAKMAGNSVFTVLDLSTAYQQIEMHEDSQMLLTVNTHLGLFRHTRMPYSISSAPANIPFSYGQRAVWTE